MYNRKIRSFTSPPLLAPRFKIFISNPRLIEPEVDMLPSEPVQRTTCILKKFNKNLLKCCYSIQQPTEQRNVGAICNNDYVKLSAV